MLLCDHHRRLICIVWGWNDGLPPIRWRHYQPGDTHAEEFLKGFSGHLTCDGVSSGCVINQRQLYRASILIHMWKAYWSWLKPMSPGSSRLAKAKSQQELYFHADMEKNHSAADWRCPLSNGIAEKTSPVVPMRGRTAGLFHDTAKAQASSLLEARRGDCKLNNLEWPCIQRPPVLACWDYKDSLKV